MIVSYSMIGDIGAGFRSRLFMPRWKIAKERLRAISAPAMPAIDARMIIGYVEASRTIVGIEGPSFVVLTCVPIAEFKKLSIAEKNVYVLDVIFESIKATHDKLGCVQPQEITHIWQDTRAALLVPKFQPSVSDALPTR